MQKLLEIDLPGFTKDQVELTVQGPLVLGTYLIKLGATSDARSHYETYTLPGRYDVSTLEAKLELGVLTIYGKLKESAVPRRIAVV